MMKWVLLFLLGCGPGLKPVPMSRDVLLGDATQLRRLMRDSVTNGGLVFDDPACAKNFGTRGEVADEKLDAFADCIAGLHLELSQREDALPGVILMQYAPGFEVQARVVDEDGARLRWIGFASRGEGDLDAPTITRAALEHLRLGGDRDPVLAPDVAADLELDTVPNLHAAYVWFKICLDNAGAIVKLDPFETTSPKATRAFVAAIAPWKFRPFVTRGAPIAVCSMVRLAHPIGAAPAVERLPLPTPPSRSKKRFVVLPSAKLLESKRISGATEVIPNDLDRLKLQQKGGEVTVVGVFRVCVDEAGAVESVLPIQPTGLVSYDRKIVSTVHDWKYQPFLVDDKPTPVCFPITTVYKQSGKPIRVEQH
jgi:hypothetical protein